MLLSLPVPRITQSMIHQVEGSKGHPQHDVSWKSGASWTAMAGHHLAALPMRNAHVISTKTPFHF